jgi:hypothetical protein
MTLIPALSLTEFGAGKQALRSPGISRPVCAQCGRLGKRALPLQSGRRAGVRSRQLRVGKQTFKRVKALAAQTQSGHQR